MHFVALVTDALARTFNAFLAEHAALLAAPAFEVDVSPLQTLDLTRAQAAVEAQRGRDFRLRVDPVAEGVSWFESIGSQSIDVDV